MDKLVQILNSIPVKLMQMIKNMQKKSLPVSTNVQPGIAETAAPVAPHPEQMSTPQVQPQVKAPQRNLSKLPLKKIAIGFGVIIVILVVLSIIMNLLPKGNGIIPGGPTPTATAVVAPVATPTQYHDDPEVINLEQNTKTLDGQLNQIQLDESNLRPRPLDFDVSF